MFKNILNILEKMGICNSYDLIIPNIYLGNFNAALDLNFLKNKKIVLIVNCSRNIPFLNNYNCEKIRIPIDDNRIFKNDDILKYLDVLEKIHEFKEKRQNVLIHCRLGSQRSANILLQYLLKYCNLNLNSATQVIKQKRPICFTPFNSFSHIY